MINRFTRFTVYALTILVANYLSDLFFQELNAYKSPNYLTVFYGMVILVVVYVPCFSVLEKYLKKASNSYVKGTKKVAGKGNKGLFFGVFLAFAVLYYFYAKLWIHRDLVDDLIGLFN